MRNCNRPLCLVISVKLLWFFLGHSRMPTQYLQMRDSIQEPSLGSISWEVSPYMETLSKLKQTKKDVLS